jgi:DNA-binding NarL/FixJ family response regulator
MAGSLKVLIADDHPLVLEGLRRTLETSTDIDVVGEACSGEEALALIECCRPDLVLLDLRMPGLDGLSCVAEIKRKWPRIKTIVLSACDDRASIDSAMLAGASAYLVKSVSPIDISSVLRRAVRGALRPSDRVPARRDERTPGHSQLTPREAAILRAVARGLTTKTISRDLWLSEHTVKFHLTNIYRKLGVSNRSAAVRYAFEHGLASSTPGAPA